VAKGNALRGVFLLSRHGGSVPQQPVQLLAKIQLYQVLESIDVPAIVEDRRDRILARPIVLLVPPCGTVIYPKHYYSDAFAPAEPSAAGAKRAQSGAVRGDLRRDASNVINTREIIGTDDEPSVYAPWECGVCRRDSQLFLRFNRSASGTSADRAACRSPLYRGRAVSSSSDNSRCLLSIRIRHCLMSSRQGLERGCRVPGGEAVSRIIRVRTFRIAASTRRSVWAESVLVMSSSCGVSKLQYNPSTVAIPTLTS
jgi:hypothetical protein